MYDNTLKENINNVDFLQRDKEWHLYNIAMKTHLYIVNTLQQSVYTLPKTLPSKSLYIQRARTCIYQPHISSKIPDFMTLQSVCYSPTTPPHQNMSLLSGISQGYQTLTSKTESLALQLL